MISGINMHCADHPTMEVVSHDGRYWIELTSGTASEHRPSSRMALFASSQPREVLERAVDGFMAAFAPVVAVIEDREPVAFREAAE